MKCDAVRFGDEQGVITHERSGKAHQVWATVAVEDNGFQGVFRGEHEQPRLKLACQSLYPLTARGVGIFRGGQPIEAFDGKIGNVLDVVNRVLSIC